MYIFWQKTIFKLSLQLSWRLSVELKTVVSVSSKVLPVGKLTNWISTIALTSAKLFLGLAQLSPACNNIKTIINKLVRLPVVNQSISEAELNEGIFYPNTKIVCLLQLRSKLIVYKTKARLTLDFTNIYFALRCVLVGFL